MGANDAPKVDHDKKYDRQIRVWGAAGQRKLESAKVCLLNGGPTGTEALKNLVLGGIASFAVVDDKKVEASDLGNNFLLDSESLGKSRALCVTELLKEMNPSVSGSYVEDSISNIIKANVGFFNPFDLVIATQISHEAAVEIEQICRAQNAILILARSYGLVGYLKISCQDHEVIESRPEHPEEDLRLKEDAVAILIQAYEKWKESNPGKPPKTSKEREAFKALVKAWQHTVDGIPIDDENFKEALENRRIFRLFTPASPRKSSDLQAEEVAALMGEADSHLQNPQANHFWVLLAALKMFVSETGSMPLEGSIPDMTAKTATYLELQRLYQQKAEEDLSRLRQHITTIEQRIGQLQPKISSAELRLFTKNARNIRLIHYPRLEEELKGTPAQMAKIRPLLQQEDTKINTSFYLLLRASDRFYNNYKYYPGASNSNLQEDTDSLMAMTKSVLSEVVGCGGDAIPEECIAEMVRFGASELHVVAAIVGGTAAQEAIKLLTAQFVPLSATLLYNCMSCTSSTLPL